MKSLVSPLLVAALCVSAFTACGNKQLDDSAARRAPARTGTNLPRAAAPSNDASAPAPKKKKKVNVDPDFVPRHGFR